MWSNNQALMLNWLIYKGFSFENLLNYYTFKSEIRKTDETESWSKIEWGNSQRKSGMTMDREKEREVELESAMYTNCLLLGLDPSIIGIGAGNGTPRVGLFRHSNPKLGEQLLYFILSSLRGPTQSAKVIATFRPVNVNFLAHLWFSLILPLLPLDVFVLFAHCNIFSGFR